MTIAIVLLSLLHLRFGGWQDISASESGKTSPRSLLSGEWQDISASGSGLAFTKDLRKLCSTLRGARLCITPSHQQVYMTRARQLPLWPRPLRSGGRSSPRTCSSGQGERCTSPKTLSNQRFTDDLMRFRGAFVPKSKEPRRNGFPLIAEPLMRGIFEECLAVDVESL